MNKKLKLVISIVLDLIGMASFAAPWIGESIDIAWAPLSFVIMNMMYKGTTGKVAGVIAALEEALPFTDFIPTFTLTWLYTYHGAGAKDDAKEPIVEIQDANS